MDAQARALSGPAAVSYRERFPNAASSHTRTDSAPPGWSSALGVVFLVMLLLALGAALAVAVIKSKDTEDGGFWRAWSEPTMVLAVAILGIRALELLLCLVNIIVSASTADMTPARVCTTCLLQMHRGCARMYVCLTL